MNKIVELLKKTKISDIRNYLNEEHKDFINNKKDLKYIDFMYGIDNYDKLVAVLEIDEEKNLLVNEMIDRINFLDIISIFKTNIPNLYFTRIEQYGYADEDAVVYRLAFCNDKKLLLEKCKEYASTNDFIKNRKNN